MQDPILNEPSNVSIVQEGHVGRGSHRRLMRLNTQLHCSQRGGSRDVGRIFI
jgi:hypothetical protein